MAELLIVTPAQPGSLNGNRVTAERWSGFLRELGHDVKIVTRFDGSRCDLMIALHARRSHASIRALRDRSPATPVALVLTGTDLYQDLRTDADAQESLAEADQVIALQERAEDVLPEFVRSKLRVIVQSVTAPLPWSPVTGSFRVCVLSHLRPVKDPLRTAHASRLLPESSDVEVLHLGAPLDALEEKAAVAEQAENPRYRWLGPTNHAEAMRILASSHLHAITSELEGGANALCEAIAIGVPSVASRISGSVGLLGAGYPGYFTVGDTGGLAELIARAESDRSFYEELRRASAARQPLVRPDAERQRLGELVAAVLDR